MNKILLSLAIAGLSVSSMLGQMPPPNPISIALKVKEPSTLGGTDGSLTAVVQSSVQLVNVNMAQVFFVDAEDPTAAQGQRKTMTIPVAVQSGTMTTADTSSLMLGYAGYSTGSTIMLTATDASGNTATASTTIGGSGTPSLSFTTTSATCTEANGSIQATVTGIVAGTSVIFTLTNPSGTVEGTNTTTTGTVTFTGLVSGTRTIYPYSSSLYCT